MIAACKEQIKAALTAAAVAPVYMNQEDVSRFKGAKYALLQADDRVGMTYDGSRVGKVDDLVAMKRTYHIRRYVTTVGIRVSVAAKDDTTAFGLLGSFLGKLSRQFDDGNGYAIEVEAGEAELITDTSIIRTGAGYEVPITFTGGIYTTKQVALIGTIVPEGEIEKEV